MESDFEHTINCLSFGYIHLPQPEYIFFFFFVPAFFVLHDCELSFWKLFKALDGQTSEPNSFYWPLGQMARTNVWEMSPLNFEPIHINNIPDLTPEVLEKSLTDARCLYDMCNLVNHVTGNTITSIHGTVSVLTSCTRKLVCCFIHDG